MHDDDYWNRERPGKGIEEFLSRVFFIVLANILIYVLFNEKSYIIDNEHSAALTIFTSSLISLLFIHIVSHFIKINKLKKIQKDLEEIDSLIPNNSYFIKTPEGIFVRPFPFLTNHEKIHIQIHYSDRIKNMPYILHKALNKKSRDNNYSPIKQTYLKYENKLYLGFYTEENGEIVFRPKSMITGDFKEDISLYKN